MIKSQELRDHATDEHRQGCGGRVYTCSCGYDKVTERLLDRDPHDMHMAYTYVDGAVMATDYSPVLSVKDAGDGTSIVEWSAHFKPLAYSNEATSAQDERALTDFFDGVYKTGLENLKRVVESGE